VVTEARLERVESGLAPVTPGWFIVNTADAAWVNNEWSGGVCSFESDDFVRAAAHRSPEYFGRGERAEPAVAGPRPTRR
jgi:hypothetical protein